MVMSGCLITLLAAFLYVVKLKYAEMMKFENTEFLNAAEKYTELKIEHSELLKAVKKKNRTYV